MAGAAAAFNCLVEKTIDAQMKRTSWRPTAKGQLSDMQALLFSAVLCSIGSVILYFAVNPLTMWLTFATFVGYAIIYTVILKPLTPQNIVIGGLSLMGVPGMVAAEVNGNTGLGRGAVKKRASTSEVSWHAARSCEGLVKLCASAVP